MEINLQLTTLHYPVPEFIYKNLQGFSEVANTYHSQPTNLRQKIADLHEVPIDYIGLTAGIDEGIKMTCLAYGKNTYIFTPTYIGYNDASKIHKKIHTISAFKNNAYEISTQTIPDATLIFLANPNNPFGHTSKQEILKLAQNNPHAMVVIDEAYAEFANLSVVRSVHNTPNLVVLRSFSKAYGMAGNRVGYMVASPQVINNTLYILDTQWDSVSYLSVGAALTALDHKEYYEKMRDNLLKIKKTFEEFLKDHNFTVLPSLINSALLAFKTEESAQQFVEYLKEKGIVVNHGNGVSNIGLDKTFVRIAIGTEQDMAEVKKCIENKYTLLSA